jgi:hypothetical protein
MDNKSSNNTEPKYLCIECDYTTSRKCNYDRHILSAKHSEDTKCSQLSEPKYICEKCNYITSKKSNYNKHLLAAKHTLDTKCIKSNEEGADNYKCECGKIYKYSQGLYKHKKICLNNNIEKPESINLNFIMEIIQENKEIKNLLIEQNKHVIELHKENKEFMNKMVLISQQPTTVINNPTTNNQNFNLNVFLNETCKDAMNMKEFIENLKVTFEDLLTIGNAGFVNGVSDLLLKSLRDIEVNKRPIHCTDVKRETMYLKEDDAWNKDDKENTKLKKALERVEYKNVVALRNWCNENLDSRVNNTPNNLLKDKIYFQTLSGDERTRDKIIKNIAKEIIISKDS